MKVVQLLVVLQQFSTTTVFFSITNAHSMLEAYKARSMAIPDEVAPVEFYWPCADGLSKA